MICVLICFYFHYPFSLLSFSIFLSSPFLCLKCLFSFHIFSFIGVSWMGFRLCVLCFLQLGFFVRCGIVGDDGPSSCWKDCWLRYWGTEIMKDLMLVEIKVTFFV